MADLEKIDLRYLEELLDLAAGRDIGLIEVGDGPNKVKVVFHQVFEPEPEGSPDVRTEDTREEQDDKSYASQLLGDDTPKFNRE